MMSTNKVSHICLHRYVIHVRFSANGSLLSLIMDYEKRQLQQSQEGEGFIAAIKSELFAPEKRQGNINIALSLTVFTGAIVFLRNFGDLLAV
jgi:hypothetical protein